MKCLNVATRYYTYIFKHIKSPWPKQFPFAHALDFGEKMRKKQNHLRGGFTVIKNGILF